MLRPLLVSLGLFAVAAPCFAWEPIAVPLSPKSLADSWVGQRHDSAVMATAEDFLLVWTDISPVPGMSIRRFDWKGAPLTPAIPLTGVTGLASGAADGSFLMAGLNGNEKPAPWGYPLWINFYDRLGKSLGAFEVAEAANCWDVERRNAGGDFLVAWSGSPPDYAKVWVARFDASGRQQGEASYVGTSRYATVRTEIAVRPDGSYTVFYEDYTDQNFLTLLYERRFDALGNPVSETILVPPEGHQETRVASAPDGGSVALFTVGNLMAGRFFDPQGGLGPGFDIPNGMDISWVLAPAYLASGDLVVAANSVLEDTAEGIQLHRLGPEGQPRGPRITLSGEVHPGVNHYWPGIATNGERIVTTYTHDGTEVYFQIFEATLFADNFESGDLSNWSLAP